MSAPLALETVGLTKRYGDHLALDGLDLKVEAGQVVGFLGPNGAGKTTALTTILGLTKPTEGRVRLFGEDAHEAGPALRARIGWLAQDPRVHGHLTAREALRHALALTTRLRGPEAEVRIDEALALAGLEALADRRAAGFSGGERQRLGLAQAWIHHPELLILDEPAASLDPMGRRDVLAILKRLRGRTTTLFSTHLLEDVERIADSVAILDRGRLRLQAPLAEVHRAGAGGRYRLTVRGDAMERLAVLAQQPWVAHVASDRDGEDTIVRVDVRDEARAETELLPLLTETRSVRVRAFGAETDRLEDVFVRLFDGSAA
ncbi:MAG: ATP-binding cassette domain-containing protein [Deinococcus-Thermus bacterium]|nr:ATP-binding cassette domain-containing protein [Deinococcota bacterium]